MDRYKYKLVNFDNNDYPESLKKLIIHLRNYIVQVIFHF